MDDLAVYWGFLMSNRRTFIVQSAAVFLASTSVSATAEEIRRPMDHASAPTNASSPPQVKKAPDALRLAIVGTGQISHRYLKQTALSSRARFVATCARTIESAKARAIEYGIDSWFDKKVAGGGAGLDTLVYPVSRLVTLLGPARRVSGFVNTLIPHRLLGDGKTIDTAPPPRNSTKSIESTVDDNATLLIEWPTGQQAMVRALWGTSIVRNDATIYGRHGTLWFSGGDIIIHSPEKEIAGATPITWGGYKNCYNVPYIRDQPSEGLIEHFVDCIKGSAEPTCGGKQQLHLHEILFKGYQAARTGRTQELETTFMPWNRIDPRNIIFPWTTSL